MTGKNFPQVCAVSNFKEAVGTNVVANLAHVVQWLERQQDSFDELVTDYPELATIVKLLDYTHDAIIKHADPLVLKVEMEKTLLAAKRAGIVDGSPIAKFRIAIETKSSPESIRFVRGRLNDARKIKLDDDDDTEWDTPITRQRRLPAFDVVDEYTKAKLGDESPSPSSSPDLSTAKKLLFRAETEGRVKRERPIAEASTEAGPSTTSSSAPHNDTPRPKRAKK